MTSGNVDQMKGRAKEAAGSLTDDDEMRREGKKDQAEGKVKNAVDKAADKAKEAADKVRDSAK